MLEALVMTVAMTTGPDHLVTPVDQKVYYETTKVNFSKPHKGAFKGIIADAAEVPKKHRAFSACVLDRESGGHLENTNSGEGARNPRSSASGRWQFLDNQWRDGLSHMVAGRLKDHGMPGSHAKSVRVYLEAKPINKWDGMWQDIGHNAVMEAGGWYHWKGGEGCNSKRP